MTRPVMFFLLGGESNLCISVFLLSPKEILSRSDERQFLDKSTSAECQLSEVEHFASACIL